MTEVKRTFVDLKGYVEASKFPAKPGPLCGWCELARSCPVARLTKDNARDNASKMRSSKQLGIPGSALDSDDLAQRRERVLGAEKAEREQSMLQAQQKVRELTERRACTD